MLSLKCFKGKKLTCNRLSQIEKLVNFITAVDYKFNPRFNIQSLKI